MNENGISKEYKELVKTFLRLLEIDATTQGVDDTEHIARMRFVLEGIAADVTSHDIDPKQAGIFFQEMKAYDRELFSQRCRDARAAHEEPEDVDEVHDYGEYFDKLYRGESHRW